jgi:hypothetical protein
MPMKILLIFQKQKMLSEEEIFVDQTVKAFIRAGDEIELYEGGVRKLIKLVKKESFDAIHFICFNKSFTLEKFALKILRQYFTSSFSKNDIKHLPMSMEYHAPVPSYINPHEFVFPIYATKSLFNDEKGVEEFCQLNLKGTKVIFGDGPLRKKIEAKYGSSMLFREMQDFSMMSHLIDVFIYTQNESVVPMYALEALMYSIPVATKNNTAVAKLLRNRFNGFSSDSFEFSALECLSLSRNDAIASVKSYLLEDRFKEQARNCLV